MSRFSRIVVAFLILLAAAYYWLLVNRGQPALPGRSIDIAALRKASDAMPGEKPTGLEYAIIATRRIPGAALAAGTGLRPISSGVVVWRIVTPRGGIVIDSGLSRNDAASMGFKEYDGRAMALAGRWMEQAELLLFTHEHVDHVGGFLDHQPFQAVAGKAVLSPRMLQGMNALWRENARLLPPPRLAEPVQPVAPGVVLVATPGHTPASQMIYVRLADGREYLFAGDTASLRANYEIPTPRSRLMADWLAPEDRPVAFAWLEALKRLKARHEALMIVPSHDPDWIAATAAKAGFSRLPAPAKTLSVN